MEEKMSKPPILLSFGMGVLGETIHAASLFFQPWKEISEIKSALKEIPAAFKSTEEENKDTTPVP
jgi:hypothetical protein